MELKGKGKRILAVCLTVALLLSMLPIHMLNGILEFKAATTTKSIVLFDDAFADDITGHHASLTEVDDPNTTGNKVLQVGDNYARLYMQNTAGISLTEAKSNAGKLIIEFYAQEAKESTLDIFVLDDVNDTYNGEEFLDFTVEKGWNTIEIPVTSITADTIYGVSVYSGIWTSSGVYHYVDNVRFEWEVAEEAPASGELILFDDAFADDITGHHDSLTVIDDPNTTGNKVLQVGDNYARLYMQNTAGISLTEAKNNAGKLVIEFYAQSASSALDVFVLDDVNDTYNGEEFLNFTVAQGWNTIEIPVTSITADTIYGVSVYSGIWTSSGVYHYVDNVRFEWGAEIEIDKQPVSAEVNVHEKTELSISASLSTDADTPELKYQWYTCDDASKTNALAIADATAATYSVKPSTAGTTYYYCTVSAEGLTSVDSDVVTVTAKPNTIVLFDDALSTGITATNGEKETITIEEGTLKGAGSDWLNLKYSEAQDWTTASTYDATLKFKVKNGYWNNPATGKVRLYITENGGIDVSIETLTATTGVWQEVEIPLSDFGADIFEEIWGIGIYTNGGSNTPYVDNVRLEWIEPEEKITITTDIIDITVSTGGTASLSIVAETNDGSDKTYQWYKCDDEKGTGAEAIEGATESTYSVPTTAMGTYYYFCRVSATDSKNVDSKIAKVAVVPTITITSNPEASTSVNAGEEVNLTVGATITDDAELSYQWFSCDNTEKDNAVKIEGATESTYSVPTDTAKTSYYFCRVSGTNNATDKDSAVAKVEVLSKLTIGTDLDEAVSVKVDENKDLTISASATGGVDVFYQWFECDDASGAGASEITGATSAIYAVDTTKAGTYYYFCRVTAGGNIQDSVVAVVTVKPVITISTHPTSGTAWVEDTANLTIAATATGDATVEYQWYKCDEDGKNEEAITGATSATYAADTTTAGTTYYFCKVTAGGEPKDSEVAALEVKQQVITIGTQPQNGGAEVKHEVQLEITASVDNGATPSYQWYKCDDANGAGASEIIGANAATYTLPSNITDVAGTYYYYCEVSATGAKTVTSNVVVIVMTKPEITISSHTPNQSCDLNAVVTLEVNAGITDNSSLTYQWYSCDKDGKNESVISGATGTSYTVDTTTKGNDYYFCRVSSVEDASNYKDSKVIIVAVDVPVISITTPSTNEVQEIGKELTIKVEATLSEAGTLTYQWYKCDKNKENGEVINGATESTYSVPTGEVGSFYYYCEVSSDGAETIKSDLIVVGVYQPEIEIDKEPTGATVATDADLNLEVEAHATNNASLSYQWYVSTTVDKADAMEVSRATKETYTVPTTTAGTYYYFCRISGDNSADKDSAVVKVVVQPIITIGTQPAATTSVWVGDNATLTVGATATGGAEVTYQWYSCDENGAYATPIDGEKSASYTASATTEGKTYYFCRVTANGITADTTVAKVEVSKQVISITTQPSDETEEIKHEVQLEIVAEITNDRELSYQWYSCTASDKTGANAIPGANAATYTLPTSVTDVAGTYYYYCEVSAAGAETVISNVAVVVMQKPVITVSETSSNVSKELGEEAILKINASITNQGALSYQWYSCDANGENATPISGATANTYSVTKEEAGNYYYFCRVSSEDADAVDSNVILLGVKTPVISISEQPANVTQEIGKEVTVQVKADITNNATLKYQWYQCDDTDRTNATIIANVTGASYKVPTDAVGTSYYYCEVSATGAAKVMSDVVIVAVYQPEIKITEESSDVVKQQGEETILEVTATITNNATLSYQWYSCEDANKVNPVAITGAIGTSYLAPTNTVGTYYYFCRISGENATTVDSSVITVKVGGKVELKETIIFDDAFADFIKNADMGNVNVVDSVEGADGVASAVIELNGGWSLSHFGTGSTGLDITDAVTYQGSLVFDIYASYGTSDSAIRVYTAAWKGTTVSYTKALAQGWNTITIPVTELNSNEFYGIGIVSHTGTCYVDNVRIEWEEVAETISINTQPQSSTIVDVDKAASLTTDAVASNNATVNYQWYSCDDASKTNPVAIEGANEATYTVPTATAGTYYYYCELTAEGIKTSYTNVVSVTVTTPASEGYLFKDNYGDGITGENVSITEGALKPSGGWTWMNLNYEEAADWSEAALYNGSLKFEIKSGWFDENENTKIRVYVDGTPYEVSNSLRVVNEWNEVSIALSDFGITDFTKVTGIGIITYGSSDTTFIDNVRLEWEEMDNTISLGTQMPGEVLVQKDSGAELKVTANVSDGSKARFQWYRCTSEDKANAELIEGATSDTYAIPDTGKAGVYYYYCSISATNAVTVTTKVFTVTIGNYSDADTNTENNSTDEKFRPIFGEDYILSTGTAFEVATDKTGTYLVTGQNSSGNWSQEVKLTAGAFNGITYGDAYVISDDKDDTALRFRVRFSQGAQDDLLYRVSILNPALAGKEEWRTISYTVDITDMIDMDSKEWQDIEVPMSAFEGSASYWDPNDANADKWGSVPVEFDWSNIIGVSFTQTVPAGATKDTSKAMHLDSIAFAKASEKDAGVVEDTKQELTSDRWIFNDALVGNNSIVKGNYAFKVQEQDAKRGTHVLIMQVAKDTSANAQIKLSPKMTLTTDQMNNAALRFWVKLPGDGGVYNISLGNDYSHVEDWATASVTVSLAAYASTLKSEWQEVVIPLSDFDVQAQYWSDSQKKLVDCEFDFNSIDSISIGSTAKTNGNILIDDLYFDYGYTVNNDGNTDDLVEGASVLQMIFGDSFGENTFIKGFYNYRITTGNAKVGNAKLEITHPWDNTEWYVTFPEALDLSDKEIYNSAAVEFWVKLNGEISWYNFYLFNQRGEKETDLGRTSVSINDFVNKKKIGEWQKVQIPLSYFTTNGKYVDDKGQLQDWEFDFSCVVGAGMAQLADKSAPTDPLVEYDDVKITIGNLPDMTYGVEIIPQDEFDAKNITFTKLDLRPYMTTGFADQTAGDGQGGWTDQGATNDLSSFTLRGEQYFESIPFDIVEPDENNGKSAIGLRQYFGGVFTEEVTIPVGQKAAGFYIIHAYSYDDSLIATYTFQYTDGTKYDVQIMKNQQIYNWWGSQESDMVRMIWSGENQDASAYNMPISLGMFPCENPYPDKEIESIRLKSETEDCAAMVLAITLADKGLYLPEAASIYNPDTSDWYVYEQPDYDKIVGSALDVSYVLDGPAGTHGYVQVNGDSFVFEDGTEALFWGTNNGETSTFQSHDEIDRYVDVLAASGMNMVRLMDIDGGYFRPNIFGFNEDNMTVDEEAMDSLCYFWAKCKEKGIYIQYCLTGVRYPSEAMNHPAYEDLALGFKTEIYFDELLVQLTKDLEETILTWENPYTGTTLATDPCVAMIEINNESNLINTFGSYSGTSYEITSEYEKALFKKLFNEYLKELYGTNEALLAAWTSDGKVALREGENLDNGTVVLDEQYQKSNFSRKRINDSFAFLYKLQSEYHEEMIRWLKEDLGVQVPITGTQNLPSNDRADIYENAHFDYLARHQYESHPQSGTDYKVGAYSGTVNSIIMNPESSSLAEDAARRVTGIPYIVNEFQMCEPNMYISEFYLVTSAIFSYQGWSGLNFPFTTGEMDDPVTNRISDFFQVMGHPLRYGTLASASLLYHRNEIGAAQEGYYTSYTEKDALNATNQGTGLPENSFIVGAAGINMESATGVKEESSDSILEKINHQTLINEGGEIIWTPDAGHFFINTSQTQAAAGTLAGETISLSDVEISTDTYFTNITVSALGLEDTIADGESILITAAARSRNTGAKLSKDGKTIVAVGEAPILVEQVEGTVTIKNTNEYEVYILNTSGERVGTATQHKDDRGYTVVEMKLGDDSMHYELVKVKDGEKTSASKYMDVSDDMAALVELVSAWLPALADTFYGMMYDVERGDFVAALVRAFELTADDTSSKYGDVEETHQGAEELKIAKALKLVNGVKLDPYAAMTRADAWLALYNAMTAAGISLNADVSALESVIADTATLTEEQQVAISALYAAGHITVEEGEKLVASEYLSREEAVILLASATDTEVSDGSGNTMEMNPWIVGLSAAAVVIVAGLGVFMYRRQKTKEATEVDNV